MLDLTVRSYSIRPKQLDQRRTLHLRRSIDHENKYVMAVNRSIFSGRKDKGRTF